MADKISLGSFVKTAKGRTGKVVHMYTSDAGDRMAFVKFTDTGIKAPMVVADLKVVR